LAFVAGLGLGKRMGVLDKYVFDGVRLYAVGKVEEKRELTNPSAPFTKF
jgi:hypothetical protein